MLRKKLNKPVSPSRRRFLKTVAIGAVVGIGPPVYAHEWEPDHPQVVQREIRLAGWPMSAAGMRIGLLSDLHCQDRRAVERGAHAAEMMQQQQPDLMLLGGDYISARRTSGWMPSCARFLAPLTGAPQGAFAILGNHDWCRADWVADELGRAGITLLRNRSLPLPGAPGVWLVGMDPYSVGAENPIQALQGVPEHAVKLLLVHEPDYADEAPLGFALQLSGHSHGGQIRVPGLPPLYCPKYGRQYPEGLEQAANHPVYTTRGIGMIGPQMRFCCPPEVTILTMQPKK